MSIVDGFNLYYRALRETPCRWLDIGQLAQRLLSNHQINRIRYFTARVSNRPNDPTKARRQEVYIRALQTIPSLSVHYGHFIEKTKFRPLARPPRTGTRMVEIRDTEEKGSDVNLATYLLLDGFDNEYDLSVVITNDSDLRLPIEKVRTRLGKVIGVYDPSRKRSFELNKAATWYRRLREGPLKASQFPPTLSDHQVSITKPAGW